MTAPLYLRNVKSGEAHRLLRETDADRYSKEQCNLDDVKEMVEITEEEYNALPVDDRCGHCAPK
jgi:hypothetical protein